MRSSHPLRRLIARLSRPFTAPLILLLAALLRFHRLSGQSLWADEGNSVALAGRGFVEIARRTAFDIHPPFYYWLLKLWTAIFGDSEIGLRSLSVVLGIGLVYLIGVLGTRLFGSRVGLLAAFIAAVSPLQIYYSQEARMYMLLALLSVLTVLAALYILQNYSAKRQRQTLAGSIYVIAVTAGLYTHYAYPLILLVVNVTVLFWFWQTWRDRTQNLTTSQSGNAQAITNNQSLLTNYQPPTTNLLNWLILQLIPLLIYLPWLPIAWRQITTWPTQEQAGSLLDILNTISTTLLFGLSWPFDWGTIPLIGLGVLLLITVWRGFSTEEYISQTQQTSRFTFQSKKFRSLPFLLLWLWFLLPVLLTSLIFSPAFLKFLLVATPPLALLLALAVEWLALRLSRWLDRPLASHQIDWVGYLVGGAVLITISGSSAVALYHYYHNSKFARDNYRGIASFIKAIGEPADAVILNAEGQQDVFSYYYEDSNTSEAPVYPLPRQRPLDAEVTVNQLEQIAASAENIYAVYWATHQADPNGLIEGWLDQHLSKATDQWYGNVRLVTYANPQAAANLEPQPVSYQFGEHIRLTGYALSSTQIVPGDILQVALTWETDEPLSENYTVFAQILDPANHVVGQRDAQPLTATVEWPAGQPIADGHGLFIEPGTPPGKHRLIVGLYSSATGERLQITSREAASGDQGRDFVELDGIEIVRPPTPLPLEAFNIQERLNEPMIDVVLLGYDLYKAGHRSTPDEPLHTGDPLHLVAYWTPRWPVQWLEDQLFIQVITPGGRSSPLFVTRQPAGTDYPIKAWQPGEIIRAQYDLFLTDLQPGTYRIAFRLGVSKVSRQQVVAVTKPFQVR